MSFTGSLKRGLVAGICAGLLAALFAFVVAEPTLDRAIALEGTHAAGLSHTGDQETPAVSRDVQRRNGAPAGFVLVGAALGLLFGLVYAGLRRPDGPGDHWQRSLRLGACGAAVLLVVFLRYPPNPPGVGDPGSVDQRTRYYLAALLLGLAVVVGSWRLLSLLRRRGWTQPARHLLVAVAAVTVIALGYLALPALNDEVTIPATLLWDFRLQSLATQLLLWGGLAAVFGVLTERAARPAA